MHGYGWRAGISKVAFSGYKNFKDLPVARLSYLQSSSVLSDPEINPELTLDVQS